jgi:hypothetical protein
MNSEKNIPSVAGIDTRPKNSRGSALRWILVALIVLGVGVLITTFALDNPIQQHFGKNNADLVSRFNMMGISKNINIISIGWQTSIDILQYKLDSAAP